MQETKAASKTATVELAKLEELAVVVAHLRTLPLQSNFIGVHRSVVQRLINVINALEPPPKLAPGWYWVKFSYSHDWSIADFDGARWWQFYATDYCNTPPVIGPSIELPEEGATLHKPKRPD